MDAFVDDSNRSIMKPRAAVLWSLASPPALPEVIQQTAANMEDIVTSTAAMLRILNLFFRVFFIQKPIYALGARFKFFAFLEFSTSKII